MKSIQTAYGTYTWNVFLKEYEFSLISRDYKSCEERFYQKHKNCFLLKTDKMYFKPYMSKDFLKKNFIVIKES